MTLPTRRRSTTVFRPFPELRWDADRLFDEMFSRPRFTMAPGGPEADFYETENEFVLEMDLPDAFSAGGGNWHWRADTGPDPDESDRPGTKTLRCFYALAGCGRRIPDIRPAAGTGVTAGKCRSSG